MRLHVIATAVIVGVVGPLSAAAFEDETASEVGFDIKGFDQSFKGVASGVGLIDSIIGIINALLVLAAIAAIVSIIAAVIPRGGDEEAAERARNAIIYSIVGIIVIILAAVIVNFFLVQIL